MLNKNAKTVLVLGAGASVEYGFPVGDKLLSYIINDNHHRDYTNALKRILFNNADFFRANNLGRQLPGNLAQHLINGDPNTVIRFPEHTFTEWLKELHHVESIDQYIFYRPDNSIIAKLCILLTLSKFENTNSFDHKMVDAPNGNSIKGTAANWYKSLWTNILSLRPKNIDELKAILGTFQFITFNYDRSLEYYLIKAINSVFPGSGILPADLPIFHVYGQLGSINPTDPNHNPYQPIRPNERLLPGMQHAEHYRLENDVHTGRVFKDIDTKLLALAMEIQTYTQVYDSNKAAEIQEIIQKANATLIFGYSFQAQNNDILWNGKSVGSIDSTSFWLGQDTCDRMSGFMKSTYSSADPQIFLPGRNDMNILRYLQNKKIPIYWPPK